MSDGSFRSRLVVPESWEVAVLERVVVAAPDVAAWATSPASPQVTGVRVEVIDLDLPTTAAQELERIHAERPAPIGCGPARRIDVTWVRFAGLGDVFVCDGDRTVTLATVADEDPSRVVLATSVVASAGEAAAVAAVLDSIAIGPARGVDGFRTDATRRIGVVFPADTTWRFFSEIGTVAATGDVGSWTAGYGGAGSGLADASGFVITLTDLGTPSDEAEMFPLIEQTLDAMFAPPSDCVATGTLPLAGAVLIGRSEGFECENGFAGSVGLAFDPDLPTFVATIVVVVDTADPVGTALVEDAVRSAVVVGP